MEVVVFVFLAILRLLHSFHRSDVLLCRSPRGWFRRCGCPGADSRRVYAKYHGAAISEV